MSHWALCTRCLVRVYCSLAKQIWPNVRALSVMFAQSRSSQHGPVPRIASYVSTQGGFASSCRVHCRARMKAIGRSCWPPAHLTIALETYLTEKQANFTEAEQRQLIAHAGVGCGARVGVTAYVAVTLIRSIALRARISCTWA